jgi:F0F1-type ATP synthase gamma subunit
VQAWAMQEGNCYLTWPLSAAVDPAKTVTVAVTSDRGLCGGLNSNITKYTKSLINMYKGKYRCRVCGQR